MKPPFDPNKPFEVVADSGKPPFDPNQPFESVDENPEKAGFGGFAQAAVADSLKNLGRAVNPLGISVGPNMAPTMSPVGLETMATPEFQRKAAPWMPAAGGVIGLGFGGLGGPIGTGLGAMAQNAMQIGTGDPEAPTTPLAAGKYAATQSALAGAFDANAVLKAAPGAASYGERAVSFATDKFNKAAVGSARRALGFTKALLNKEGGQQRAAKAAETLLDAGAVKPFSGAAGLQESVEATGKAAAQKMTNTLRSLDQAGVKSIDPNTVVRDVYAQLSPRFSGGAYDAEKKVLDEVVETIRAHGNGPITFDSAQKLKQKLQGLGKFQQGGDNLRADMYARASGIVRKAIDDAVEAGSPAASPSYREAKKVSSAALEAERGLRNRVSSEQGNRIIGASDFFVGGTAALGMYGSGERDKGDYAQNLGLLFLGKRGIERYGGTTAAWAYKGAAEALKKGAFAINPARQALISRIITKEGETE